MTVDDEQLMQLLLRTTRLVHRKRESYDEATPNREPRPGFESDSGDDCDSGEGPRSRPPRSRPLHPGPPHRKPPSAQGRVLAMLMVKEGLSQKELAYLMGIRPQSLTETLGHLEETGHIERKRSSEDGRMVNVYLTEHGRERATLAAENRRRHAQDVFSALDEHDKEELERILTKLDDALD